MMNDTATIVNNDAPVTNDIPNNFGKKFELFVDDSVAFVGSTSDVVNVIVVVVVTMDDWPSISTLPFSLDVSVSEK